ncbi:hypothetical protein A6A08_05160 [Nocardiopsis sp. TSRI0078]|uniref:hypothetical protein n=1 Tax=unclassified Nocardiopsis TaxID=2649073 RepID=UPI000938F2DC|nr:hypothetical protein [Nocardiopsis sp. TSRI0078]OKI18995.1 hypothetical protein A6A08_05160 [Nocardiopsis sp. TSRI0078]
MLHRGVTFAHATFLVLSALLSFLVVREFLEATPGPLATLVQVRGADEAAGRDGVHEAVASFTEEHRVNIALEVTDPRDPGGVRHLYLAVGAPEQPGGSWLEQGYPGLSPGYRTEVHSWAEAADLDPRGAYHLLGPEEGAHAFVDAVSAYGLDAHLAPAHENDEWFKVARDGAFSDAFAIAVLYGVVAVGTGVLLNARSYAVLRLQGMSPARILLRDLVQLARFWAVAAPGVAAAAAGLLLLHGALSRAGLLLEVALSYLSVFTAVGLATHAAALALVHVPGIVPALKGRLPARLATAGAYAVRVPALVLVLGLTANLALSLQVLQGQQEGQALFAEADGVSRLHFAQNVDELYEQETTEEFGESLRTLEARGRLLLAAPSDDTSTLGGTSRSLPGGLAMIVVNDAYLERHPVLGLAGESHGPSSGGGVRVLVPGTHADLEDALGEEVGRRLRESWEEAGDTPPRVGVETALSRPGQRLFTYGATPMGNRSGIPFVQDPVVVAVPNGSEILRPARYRDYAMSGAALVLDGGKDTAVEEWALPAYLDSVQPVALKAADEYRDASFQVRMEGFALAAAIGVLFITGITVCVVHVRTHAQAVLARHLHGWSFPATHRTLLMLEVPLAAAFVGWAGWNSARALALLRDPAFPAPAPSIVQALTLEPFLAAGTAALGLGLVLAVLALLHRRVVREGTAEA